MGEDPNRGIEREVLPTCRRYGMGTLVWSPPAMGLLTGRYRKGRPKARNARMNWVPLDRIDQIVAPGTDIDPLDVSYTPPAINRPALRRRSADERAAA